MKSSPVKLSPLSPEPCTEAEVYVQEKLLEIMPPDSKYRVGALFLTYGGSGSEEPGCRIAQAVGMKEVTLESAVDLVQLIKAFRHLASHLEEQYSKRGGSNFDALVPQYHLGPGRFHLGFQRMAGEPSKPHRELVFNVSPDVVERMFTAPVGGNWTAVERRKDGTERRWDLGIAVEANVLPSLTWPDEASE